MIAAGSWHNSSKLGQPMPETPRNHSLLKIIRSRRVSRYFLENSIPMPELEAIVEAGRWSPCAGNRRLQRFVVVTEFPLIETIRIMAPGIDGYPRALIVLCIDWEMARVQGIKPTHPSVYIDTGMATENLLLAAHVLKIGAGPVTSFSKAAVQEILDLPESLSPELIVCLGYPAASTRGGKVKPPKALHWRDITYWNRFQKSNL